MAATPYYDRDGIVIYHGDCRAVLPDLSAESIDLVVTDPPYAVRHVGNWDRKHRPIQGDDDLCWVEPVFRKLFRLLKPDTLCVSFYGWPHADTFLSTWKRVGFRPVSHLAFVKTVWGLGRMTRSQHETAYILAKGQPPRPVVSLSDTIEWVREPEAFHPHQKPVAALLPLIAAYAAEGQTVLDPFMGSGSPSGPPRMPAATPSGWRSRSATARSRRAGWSKGSCSRPGGRIRCRRQRRRCLPKGNEGRHSTAQGGG